MNELFLEQVYNFVDEYYALYNIDQYISKKRIDELYDKYSDIIELSSKYQCISDKKYKTFLFILNYGYEKFCERNKKYVEKKLIQEKDYFDNVFKTIDENIVLDEEQRKAILIDEDYSLIVAGAGSGKTTTMAAKVKYLIERKKVNPTSIILLSFTNASVNDLNDLINNKFKLNVEVLTFHKLGMKFIRNIYARQPEIISDSGIYEIISEYFLNIVFKNKQLLKRYIDVFSKYLLLDEESMKFKNYDEYYKYYMDKKYEQCKDNLKEEIKRRVSNRSRNFITINGEKVKSDGEVKIANYLYKRSISYKYEEQYPYNINGNRLYKPDFTIDNFGVPIYIEYYGLAFFKNDGTYISEIEKYQTGIGVKKNTHIKNKTDLIELYGKYENGDYFLPVLSNELSKRNVEKKLKSDKEIFYKLMETAKTFKYNRLIKLFQIFIRLFKEKNYTFNDFESLEINCDDEVVKEQLKYIKDVYNYYQKTIRKKFKIDFQDMIHYAYENIEHLKANNTSINYEYVIIDEYQDVSYQRYSFAKKISDLFNAKIVAVGDDWQTIYSFSGSDIDLFTNFNEIMGYGEQIHITNTYRNSQELIDLAGNFVLKNSSQIEKRLYSNKHLNKPVKMIEYDYSEDNDDLAFKLENLLKEIYDKNPNESILLLSRFNNELEKLLDSKLFYKSSLKDNRITCKSIPNAKIDFLTVHKSKGLGYDRVILLNGIDGTYGFPSQIKDEPVIKYIKGELYEIKDIIEYPEERRLFYVALTRTKNELYIMIPTLYEYRSDFIKEISTDKNVKIIEKSII